MDAEVAENLFCKFVSSLKAVSTLLELTAAVPTLCTNLEPNAHAKNIFCIAESVEIRIDSVLLASEIFQFNQTL